MPHQQGDNSKDIETHMIERCANCANNGTFPKAKHISLYQTWLPCEWFCKFGRLFWLFALYLFHKIPQQKTGNIIHSSGIDVHPGLNASASLFDHLDPMFIQFSCNKKQLKIHNSYRKNNQAKLPWLFLWTLSIIIHLNFSTKKHLGVYVLQKIPVASCKFRFVGKSCTFKWPPSHGTRTKKVRVFQTSTLLNSKGL